MLNPDACIINTPSDQAIFNEEAFRKNVLEGLAFVAANDRFLTMAVKPTRPEPGYGYIQMGDVVERRNLSVISPRSLLRVASSIGIQVSS